MFDCIFTNNEITAQTIFACLGCALVTGLIFACLCGIKTRSTKSFLIATALLPMIVALVILLVNGNIGAGVAIAGAFSLVRFRSAPGTAKEICVIFIAMATGLAFGMGYLAYGVIVMLGSGAVMLALDALKLWDKKDTKEKILVVTMPEELNYGSVFDEAFARYTSKHTLIKTKTTNMGSMFKVWYEVTMKDTAQEKDFLDEIRCLNGNLEVCVQRIEYASIEL